MAEELIHHHHHHHHHHSSHHGANGTFAENATIVRVATGIKIGLYVLTVYLAVATAAGEMTMRNVSGSGVAVNVITIAAWFFIAEFINAWILRHTNNYFEKISMKKFKLILLAVGIICGIKATISLLFLPVSLSDESALMAFYYAGEALAWVGLTIFFFLYLIKEGTKHSK